MNFNDIHMGDIAVTKEGVRYKIINFYYTYRKREEIRLDLQPITLDSFIDTIKNDSETIFSHTDYAWIGQIDNLNKTFNKIGEFELNTDKEEAKQKIEQLCKELTELKRMIEDM